MNVSELKNIGSVREGRRDSLDDQHQIVQNEHPLLFHRVHPFQPTVLSEISFDPVKRNSRMHGAQHGHIQIGEERDRQQRAHSLDRMIELIEWTH